MEGKEGMPDLPRYYTYFVGWYFRFREWARMTKAIPVEKGTCALRHGAKINVA